MKNLGCLGTVRIFLQGSISGEASRLEHIEKGMQAACTRSEPAGLQASAPLGCFSSCVHQPLGMAANLAALTEESGVCPIFLKRTAML